MRASNGDGERRVSDGALQIRLLGELQVARGGVPAALPASRRTRALLGYLVATGTPQSRSALCDLLWDGPEDPRGSLRWSLTKLRPVVDDDGLPRLVADRERVAFDAQRCTVDTAQIAQLLSAGPAATALPELEQAAALLQGEFLDGLDLPACYRFHHWCMAERERLGRVRREVLSALVERLAHEPQRALPYGHAMVAADPLAEGAHAALVRLLAADGRYPDAERHHDWARELLRREVALAAGGPLDEAIRAVRRAQREGGARPAVDAAADAAPHAAADAADAAPDTTPDAATVAACTPVPPQASARALVGRSAERRLIDAALATPDPARLLLFTGEPGIGKTRLLDHLADIAAAAGHCVLRGRCFEVEMVRPYGLWLDALRALPADTLGSELRAQAAPLLTGRAAAGGDRERLFGAAAELVAHLAAQRPTVLLLDDLQWIDEGSAALLHYVMRSLPANAPLLVAGAARSGELDDNAWAKGLLQSLARGGSLKRQPLAPLDEAEAHALIGRAPLDAAEAVRLAGGNPLYLLELVRAAAHTTDNATEPGPGGIAALVDERLQALDPPVRDLLGWAAAFGGALRPELLAAAADLPLAELLSRLEWLERRGLLAAGGAGRLDFAHDIVRQAVYRALSQPRRQAMHRRCARVLCASATDDPGLHGEVVHHAALAQDAPAATRACLAAGDHCLRVFANGQAAALAERGLRTVEALPPGPERIELEIGLLRLRVAAAAGPGGRRLPALAERIEAAIAAAEALGQHAQASAGWEILAFWRQQAGDAAHAQQASLAAQRLARRADSATHCRQLANSGRCLLDIEADPVRGSALLDEASTLADELDLQVMELHWGRGLIARRRGDLPQAVAALTQAVELARLTGNHWREIECRLWLATAELERGCPAEVLRQVEEIEAAARRMGEQAPFAQALAALARLQQGEQAAWGPLGEAIADLRTLDDKAHLAYALNDAAALALDAGRAADAAAWADEALAAARAVRRPTEVAVATAWGALAETDPRRAAQRLAGLPPGEPPSERAAAALAHAARVLAASTT
ncbi:AAA family ATPase [Aquincola sp. S2]|uniref:AAA family ATPase n=1 Tax=Pseudaquabacterium terrae TaxID=2732868 RepID=A0ABX2EFA8_9BURK|nr:AAA family ATPase [Aquabacterium terrae]NRF67288.1 AAA family ATPase [Aquabacterium terrae]